MDDITFFAVNLAVYRGIEKSESTALRIIFNASSLTTEENSLKSIQYNKGLIQDDLFSIMARFRKYICLLSQHTFKTCIEQFLFLQNRESCKKFYGRKALTNQLRTLN